MANYTFTSNTNSVLFDADGKQAPFGDKELHPYTPDRSGNQVYLYDSTGIIKKIGVSSTHQESNRSKDRIPLDIGVDTINVDGTTVWADAGALLDALRAIFFLTSGGGGSGQGWDGVVANRNALPIADPPAVGSVYLAENPVLIAGIYKQYTSGLYIRQTSTGALSDWRKLNTKSRFTTSEFRVLDASDQTKQIAIVNAGQTTGTTRTWTSQDKDIVVADDVDLQNEASARQAVDEGTVTVHNDVGDAGSGDIITAQERTDINASVGVHSDVDPAGVTLSDNTVLRYNTVTTEFVACLHRIIRSSALVINSTNVLQDKINVGVDVQRLVPHKITVSYQWSLNDGAQDFISVASFGGTRIQNSLTPDELHRQEPKDTAGADPDGRGTNQKQGFTKSYFVTPATAGNNVMLLQFAGSANGDLASIWEVCVEVEELISVIGN